MHPFVNEIKKNRGIGAAVETIVVSLLLPKFMVMHVMNSRQHQAVKREQELLFGVAWRWWRLRNYNHTKKNTLYLNLGPIPHSRN
jgi:hypothetical protein